MFGKTVVPGRRRVKFRGAFAVAALSLAAAGCSSDSALFRADSSWWSSGKSAASEPLARPAPQEALIGPDGSCAAATGERHAVAIGMTECDVVSALGTTPLIDIGTNERGERAVVLTYSEGERAGIYRFVSGRLTSIEALAEKPKPQRPKPRKQAPQTKPKPKAQPEVAQPRPSRQSPEQPAPSGAPAPSASPWPAPQPQSQPAPWPAPAAQPQPAPWPAPAAQPQSAPWPEPPKS